jgi:hypothetical protein
LAPTAKMFDELVPQIANRCELVGLDIGSTAVPLNRRIVPDPPTKNTSVGLVPQAPNRFAVTPVLKDCQEFPL